MSTHPSNRITVAVPATSANLGAGFDVLGLALSLHNVFHIEPAGEISITAEGYTEGLPLDSSNLFYKSFAHLMSMAGQPQPNYRVRMEIGLPPGRGLGSSATAVVGGLVAANAILGRRYSDEQILAEAVRLERGGHPDNVAPALLGGLVVNAAGSEGLIALKVPFPTDIKAVLFIPELAMDTVQGRGLMPAGYSREDVVFSTGRVGLFVAAITQGRYDLLRTAMEDRLHQPYRAVLFPAFPELIEAAIRGGAYGASLSGGGSSVLALAGDNAVVVAEAMERLAHAEGIEGRALVVEIDTQGARITQGRDEA